MPKKDNPQINCRVEQKDFIQFHRQARKYRVTNTKLFTAMIQMAKDYPESLEKFL